VPSFSELEYNVEWYMKTGGNGGIQRLTCSALTTSIITPPFNMRANPSLTDCEFDPLVSPFFVEEPLVMVGSSVAIIEVSSFDFQIVN
jgi:hypothetical protein